MLNHFNFRKTGHSFLLTNDFGRYVFLSEEEFKSVLNGSIKNNAELYEKLRKGYFILENRAELFSEERVFALREMKNYLFSGTSLHIFVVTNACNLNCIYCQAKDKSSSLGGFMNVETGKKAVRLALQTPENDLTFEFQGGEPLLNFDVIKEMILETERLKGTKKVSYTMVSNLLALTEDKLTFLEQYDVQVSTSLDGPKVLHDRNRRISKPGSSFDVVKAGYQLLQRRGLDGGAIETTTRFSLTHPEEIVDCYREFGMNGIFLRPLTPLGFASANWKEIGYTPQEYLEFYKRAFQHILDINREGTVFPEFTARYFLEKILNGYSINYMELRSPCGAATGQLTYYYNGKVYTCDEGRMISEMGDNAFELGTVDNTYEELMSSPVCKATQAASILESLPTCSDCVYQPYCGVCPAVTYALDGDIFPRRPKGFRCKIYEGIQDLLFEYLRENDPEVMSILRSWVTDVTERES